MNESYNIRTSGDALLHCEVSGSEDAPPLVFLHGNGEDMRIFDFAISHFSLYYRTIAVDTRGHGQSTRGTSPLDFYTFASDLLEVLDALHIDKTTVIGFSDGANTVLHVALKAPERIQAMILLGANYHPKGLRLKPYLLIRLTYIGLIVASLFSTKIRKRKEIWGLMISEPNLAVEELSQIAVPTLVATGENDMVSQSHNDKIIQAIKGAKRFIIPGGDHFWPFNKQELFKQCVADFLENY